MQSIRTFNDNVARIGEFHSRSLGRSGPDTEIASQLDDLHSQTSDQDSGDPGRFRENRADLDTTGNDWAVLISTIQTALVKSKFIQAIQNYQSVEQLYRTRQKERIERQFKIGATQLSGFTVKPGASPEEIKAVVNDDRGQGQVFAQALMDSRYGDSQSASREVQERHEDIKRIERTLAELAQLFSDMSVITDQQQENVEQIERSAGKVEKDTEAGYVQTELAVVYARAARNKRWVCFGIVVIILAIIGIALGVHFGSKLEVGPQCFHECFFTNVDPGIMHMDHDLCIGREASSVDFPTQVTTQSRLVKSSEEVILAPPTWLAKSDRKAPPNFFHGLVTSKLELLLIPQGLNSSVKGLPSLISIHALSPVSPSQMDSGSTCFCGSVNLDPSCNAGGKLHLAYTGSCSDSDRTLLEQHEEPFQQNV
ncbi:hypothetical protein D9757_005747 [Collybiopsis confluens]|uniref:t-SNARE coiled-coil homology domain-containing protein n=1 Tax=Collybiopsis confluens TaxID=2823264 RepID=A0A8H5HPU6_9AGAR|nr:hypothetical protein D9757_005747 [Collybiopsis confluens]